MVRSTDLSVPLLGVHTTELNFVMTSRKLLIAVDSSETSQYAFQWSVDHVLRKSDHVVLSTVVLVPPSPEEVC